MVGKSSKILNEFDKMNKIYYFLKTMNKKEQLICGSDNKIIINYKTISNLGPYQILTNNKDSNYIYFLKNKKMIKMNNCKIVPMDE